MGRAGLDAESELVVIWGALPTPQIVDYHDCALYIDSVTWHRMSITQRWNTVQGLRGLSVSEEMRYHAHGNPLQLEQDAERLAQITETLWTSLVEMEQVVGGLCAQTVVLVG